MSSGLIYVVTGANRGIGLAVATKLAKSNTVIATVRSKDKVKGTALEANANVKIVELEAGSQASIDAAVTEIEALAPDGIDVLWNNAGVLNSGNSDFSMKTIGFDGFVKDVTVNTVSPVYLSSKLLPSLAKRGTKKVVFTTSQLGSFASTLAIAPILNLLKIPYGYSASKSALNMAALYLHKEFYEKGFLFVLLHPGLVDTDMNHSLDIDPSSIPASFPPAISVDESSNGLISVVDGIKYEGYAFEFFNYDGTIIPW